MRRTKVRVRKASRTAKGLPVAGEAAAEAESETGVISEMAGNPSCAPCAGDSPEPSSSPVPDSPAATSAPYGLEAESSATAFSTAWSGAGAEVSAGSEGFSTGSRSEPETGWASDASCPSPWGLIIVRHGYRPPRHWHAGGMVYIVATPKSVSMGMDWGRAGRRWRRLAPIRYGFP